MDDKHFCPRRNESPFGMRDSEPRPDTWRQRDGIRACSYCGSVHPDDFFAALGAGNEVGPTDKSYKVYIKIADPLAGTDRVVSAIAHDPDDADRSGWVKADPAVLKRDGWTSDGYKWMRFTTRGPQRDCKFYFQHLSPEQQQRFIDMLNAKTMNIGYPGHFYVRPFFVSYPEKR